MRFTRTPSSKTTDRQALNLAHLHRLELLAHACFQDGPAAQSMLKQLAAGALESVPTGGEVQEFSTGSTPRAMLVQGQTEDSSFGCRLEVLHIHLVPGDAEAIRWAERQISQLLISTDRVCTLALSGAHQALIPSLVEAGLGVDCVELIGESAPSLERLVAWRDPPRDFLGAGLTHVPMELEHLDAAISLRRETFSREPRYCWFGAHEGHLSRYRERMAEELGGDHLWRVLLDRGDLVGIYGSSVVASNPLWGPRGGLELIFRPELRGRGLAKTAYRLTLEDLVAKGLHVYKGATSQPAVMAMAQRMGRSLQQVHLRSGAHFPPEHFRSYLDRCQGVG